jgi:class 3 adenylate cyclase/tetratricopeptide (TPR) repeat protein
MTCTSCGRTNPAVARFCAGCGQPLAPRCAACGAENEGDARFCIACGASLAARPPPAAEKAIARKVVTVLFADLIGSVSLQERLDAESARRVMDRYHRTMTAAVEVHGGKVVQLLGDGVLAAFGVPRVAEDDALRAVRAAVGMQRAFRELARELGAPLEGVGLRVAVNTGEIVVGDDETAVIGDPTNVAARLQHEARDGDVLVGEATQRLVAGLVTLAPAGTFALKGRSETVTAHRVVSLDRPAGARATSFVGREEELGRLVAVYGDAVATPSARLAVLLGSPGLGKSRLIDEFTRRAGDRANVLGARCDAAGGGTFTPIADALRTFLRIEEGAGANGLRAAIVAVVAGDDAERARIAGGIEALFSGAPSSPEETFFAVRRLLAALAAVRPVVLVIDDLHWAEPLLFDLVEHLAQWSTGVPLFLLVAARPELRESRSSLATPGGLVADVITLGGLDAGASMQLAASVVGAAELPAALVGRVLATSEGNPLFLGELVRMLVLDGTLARQGERWVTTVEVAKLDMPPTIHALLAARIERLRPEERAVLERAAVIGRQFSRAAVAHLLGPTPDLDARLEALRRSELIEPDTGWFLGEPALRFHHVLIRDAAYRQVLKEKRAELHERLAEWIIGRVGDAVEHDEIIGFHLEQAHQNRLELGPLDDHGRTLGERAARRLGAAGRRALARDDVALAGGLLGRALERLDRADTARADLALDWCEALLAAGDVATATRAIEELGRFTGGSERLRAWHTCFAGQLAVLSDPESLHASEGAVATAAETLAAAGDTAGEAKAHSIHALVLAQLGRIGACEAALDRALAAARRVSGERRLANAVLAGAPLAALWGPSPVTRASGRCLDVVRVLRITQGAPAVEAVALRCQAVLETLRGRGEAARRMIASSRRLVEELGITQRVLEADLFAGLIELLEGDAAAAEGLLRRAWDGLRAQRLGIAAAQAGALLARALLAQDRIGEAEVVSRESEALAGDSFQAAIAWRGVRAEVLAARGENDAAIDLARAAVEIAAATDDLLDHADARASLGVALRAAGRGPEAEAEERRAVELWEAKGATLLVERARRGATPQARPAPVPLFDTGRAAEALAATRVAGCVRANAAAAALDRLAAALAARDFDALGALHAERLRVVHHVTGTVLDRQGTLDWWRAYLGDRDVSFTVEPLAVLGDALALSQLSWSGSTSDDPLLDVGAFESTELDLVEVDAEGRAVQIAVFAPDRLGDAVGRLYERYAELLPEGPGRERAALRARATMAMRLLPGQLEPFAAVLSADVEAVDHRVLGTWAARGPETILAHWRSLQEVADNVVMRMDDVLALQPDASLVRMTYAGTVRSSGGLFERTLLALSAVGTDGLVARLEMFDPGQEAEALARFDALISRPAEARYDSGDPARARYQALGAAAPHDSSAALVKPNKASAAMERAQAAIATRNWAAVRALAADGARFEDRRRFARITLDADGWVMDLKRIAKAEAFEFRRTLVATAGDRVCLERELFAGGRSGGRVEVEIFLVAEVDEGGRFVKCALFDLDARRDAQREALDRWLAADPAAAAVIEPVLEILRGFNDHDRARIRAALADDAVMLDHRLSGIETIGADAYVESLAVFWPDVPDARSDWFPLLQDRRGCLGVGSVFGTFEGGPFEVSLISLLEVDQGRVTRIEIFERQDLERARARFAELRRMT